MTKLLTLLRLIVAVPVFVVWLATLPFSWIGGLAGKFLGFDEL